ncbi:hypothetical protein RRF57_009132 [Xylaria bambusicola]|uniref:DUF7025 domain-containing protein n=1 Tax=Xylaria bambusicola TaxID=326684 RepID=A0AAN7UP86_9PEZI
MLEDVFRNYPGITAGLEMLTFTAPFRAFFRKLNESRLSARNQTDQKTVDHLELLYNVILTAMKHTLQVHQDLITHQVITYDYFWALFPLGELIYAESRNHDRIFLVSKEVIQTKCGLVIS